MSDSVIHFLAEIYKLQTLADGGIRVTLNLPETSIPQMAQLAECSRRGVLISVNADPVEEDAQDNKLQELLNN